MEIDVNIRFLKRSTKGR